MPCRNDATLVRCVALLGIYLFSPVRSEVKYTGRPQLQNILKLREERYDPTASASLITAAPISHSRLRLCVLSMRELSQYVRRLFATEIGRKHAEEQVP